MRAVKSALVATASVAAFVSVLGASPAMAGIPFTWDPGLIGLSSGGVTQFTADDIVVSDFATITLGPNTGTASNPVYNSVSESAILPITQFTLGGTKVAQGGSAYTLYFDVTAATSSISGTPASLVGKFNTLSYTLFGVTGGCTFNASLGGPSATCGGTKFTIATGGVSSTAFGPGNNVSVTAGDPAAHANVTIIPDSTNGAFFVSPNATSIANDLFISAFTNSAAQFFCGTTKCSFENPAISAVVIKSTAGGGISLTAVPEPDTLAVFGLGLLGLGWFARRRKIV